MPGAAKLLIGLAAALLAGWVHFSLLGNGPRFVDATEARAHEIIVATELTQVQVRLGHDPLTRTATLSGPADDFQRNGMGSAKGLTQMIAGVPGVAAVQWADEPASVRATPLIVESLALVALAYLAGLGMGRLAWGRPQPERYA